MRLHRDRCAIAFLKKIWIFRDIRACSHLAFFFFSQRYFYIVFLCSRALLENAPLCVFLNASLWRFFLPAPSVKKKVEKSSTVRKKAPDVRRFFDSWPITVRDCASSKRSSWTMMVGTLLLPSPGDICTNKRAGTWFSSSLSGRANASATRLFLAML